ncbi:hypothetical protein D9M71_482730 [compost metagenome]
MLLISRIDTKAQAAITLASMPISEMPETSAPLGLATSSTPAKPMAVASSMRLVSGSCSQRQAISGVNTGAA